MLKEDYVSLETAKLLKEKWFDKDVDDRFSPHFAYNKDGQFSGPSWDTEYNAPTLQMAMKWLREVHNFNVNIELTIHGYFCSLSHIVRDSSGYIIDIEDSEAWETAYYDSYEEACENSIKYCLENLI